MKTISRFFLVLAMGVGALTACLDELPEGDGVASTESALALRGASEPADPTEHPIVRRGPNGTLVTASGGPVTTFDDFSSERPVGVLEDCTATAECGAFCSVAGDGWCDAGATFVACSFTYPCGKNKDNTCTSTTRVDCD